MAYKLFDPVFQRTGTKIWQYPVNNTLGLTLKTYHSVSYKRLIHFCNKNGPDRTTVNSGAKENAFQINLSPTADETEIHQEKPEHVHVSEIESLIETIRYMFQSMEDGEISLSPYDTAWVALVPALDGCGKPEFGESLEWIMDHQLRDGSWGDPHFLNFADRILNTLACVIALKTWNVLPQSLDKGLCFLRKYISRMKDEAEVYNPIAFEIIFPPLMEDAKAMNLDLPYDVEFLTKIYNERDLKLKRIPMDVLHNHPSTLLHSVEGLRDRVEWGKLAKLQSSNGSLLFSPAATACALAHTGDPNYRNYLKYITKKHNGGAPNTYPVDLFEHLWMVDRLERLGIARYFQKEITDCLRYVYRYWTDEGIGWARDSSVKDLDDTSMAFRLLRLHGFHVTTEAFSHFKQADKFICFKGQVSQAVTGMYNLYRASQVLFPGESILEEAQIFSKNFLEEKRTKNQISDKWIISKGLVGEVKYALNFPWYASQPRIEARMYIEHYGVDDVWVGKSLYRMPFVNNKTYLDLAKADFNLCQSIHKKELMAIIRWSIECQFEDVGLTQDSIVRSYFLAVVGLFEPEMAPARLASAHSAILMAAVRALFSCQLFSQHHKRLFLAAFARQDVAEMRGDSPENVNAKRMLKCLFRMINSISIDGSLKQGRDISGELTQTWQHWLAKEVGTDEEMKAGSEGEVIVVSASLLVGKVNSPYDSHFINLKNKLSSFSNALSIYKIKKGTPEWMWDKMANNQKHSINEMMREIICDVLKGYSGGVPDKVKHVFLTMSKSFYYETYCNDEEMSYHEEMILFQPLM